MGRLENLKLEKNERPLEPMISCNIFERKDDDRFRCEPADRPSCFRVIKTSSVSWKELEK